jgi:hypothetical protein
VFCALHDSERELCEQFWEGDAIEKLLADHILIPAYNRLAEDPLPLLRLLAALAEGPLAGWYCLSFISQPVTDLPPILPTVLARLQSNAAPLAEAEVGPAAT